jgi:S1-C subfamily serine protease
VISHVMEVGRHAGGHDGRRGLTIGIAVAASSALIVFACAERGVFSRLTSEGGGIAIPGMTIDNNSVAPIPVVTSVRSDSEAQRLGVRAGDAILSVDGHPVRDLAALRAAVYQAPDTAPLDLHIRRGDAVLDVSIDRTGSSGKTSTGSMHGPENSAG